MSSDHASTPRSGSLPSSGATFLAPLRFAVNLSMLFADRPLLERPAAARAAGFDAAELWWPFETPVPSTRQADELVAAFREADLRLVLLNLFLGDGGAGQHGLLALDPTATPFRENVDAVADLVGRLGGSIVNSHVGNLESGQSLAGCRPQVMANLAWAAPRVAAAGATLVVEPLNHHDFPRYALTRSDDAVALTRAATTRTGTPIRILFDVYHAAREDEALVAQLTRFAPDIGHVQVADVPGRGRPGSGAIDFEAVFGALAQAGHEGAIGLEYRPSADPDDTFSWLPAAQRRWRG